MEFVDQEVCIVALQTDCRVDAQSAIGNDLVAFFVIQIVVVSAVDEAPARTLTLSLVNCTLYALSVYLLFFTCLT